MTETNQPAAVAAPPDIAWGNAGGLGEQAYWRNRSWTTTHICESFLDYVTREFKCAAACAWSLDPVNQVLIAVALKGIDHVDMRVFTLPCAECLSGDAVDRRQINPFPDLRAAGRDGRFFRHMHLTEPPLGLTGMLSIPVLNTSNPNQVLLIVNLFAAGGALPPPDDHGRLRDLARDLAATVEGSLYDHCIRYANRLPLALAKVRKSNPDRQCGIVAELVRHAIGCDTVGVYLVNDERGRLEMVGKDDSAGLYNEAAMLHFSAMNCWKRNREELHVDLGQGLARSERPITARPLAEGEEAGRRDEMMSAVCVPLQALSGQPRGVIQCLNRSAATAGGMLRTFTYDDVAVIEAIGRSFSPQLAVVQADKQRIESLNRLAHELRVPVVASRAALARVRKECIANDYKFQFEHFEEMKIYGNVMTRLLKELDLMRHGTHAIPLAPEKTYLVRKIIAPAVRFVAPLLAKAGFKRDAITYIVDIPELYVDQGLMTQVVFNLLDNAIKYYQGDPAQFSMLIEGNKAAEGFELVFRDQGIGIEPGDEKTIFEQGVRGRNAHDYDVSGEGIGLWLARAIVRRHGGALFVRQNRAPTKFVLRLPHELQYGPPPENISVDD
jgi:signal transduction histidine kinase